MASVTFDKATRRFPSMERPAVDSLDLEIEDGEFMVLLGPSGCGKSTCLRMLAGLEEVDSGSVLIGVRDVTHLPPRDRDIAMVFQDYALLPHLSAADNMGFALKIARMSKVPARQRVDHAAAVLDLEQYLGRRPRTLAGGERQRVATGRVLVRDPRVYLMDEPLSNLDARLRAQTRTEIVRLQNHLGITTVYVTHDQTEAMAVGDRLAVLEDGVLQQVGTPKEVYAHPANTFVAGFVGSPAMNLFRLPLSADGARLGALNIPLTRATLRAAAAGAPTRSCSASGPNSSSCSRPGTGRLPDWTSSSRRSRTPAPSSSSTPPHGPARGSPPSSSGSRGAPPTAQVRRCGWPCARTPCTASRPLRVGGSRRTRTHQP